MSNAAPRDVLRASRIQAEPTVRASTHDAAVVIVLPVILPFALCTDFVRAPLIEGTVTAAGARVLLSGLRSEDVELSVIEVEPGFPACEYFVVAEAGTVAWATDDFSHVTHDAAPGTHERRPRGTVSAPFKTAASG